MQFAGFQLQFLVARDEGRLQPAPAVTQAITAALPGLVDAANAAADGVVRYAVPLTSASVLASMRFGTCRPLTATQPRRAPSASIVSSPFHDSRTGQLRLGDASSSKVSLDSPTLRRHQPALRRMPHPVPTYLLQSRFGLADFGMDSQLASHVRRRRHS
jgi:hypothetical protein